MHLANAIRGLALTAALVASASAAPFAAEGTWSPAGSMSEGRYAHAATALLDGHVLVTGGISRWYLASAEIYDPATNRWTPAAPMNVPRYQHTLTTLRDADGDVLTYTWKLGTATLATSRDPVKTAHVQLGLGTHVLTLVVSDGEKTATDDVVVTVQDGSAEQAARIAELQAEKDALLARNEELQLLVDGLRGQVSGLEHDRERLRADLTAANAAIASLHAQLADAIRAVESDLQSTFSDPQFAITGVAPLDRLRSLVLALQQLERGRKLGIYTNLGGQPRAGSK